MKKIILTLILVFMLAVSASAYTDAQLKQAAQDFAANNGISYDLALTLIKNMDIERAIALANNSDFAGLMELARQSFGGKNVQTKIYPRSMRSVQALGMGDAFYVKSDNKYAPFYNPAGLDRIQDPHVDIIPLSFEVNREFKNFYYDVVTLDTDDDGSVAELAIEYLGKNMHIGLGFYPGYVRKDFLIGMYADSEANVSTSLYLPDTGEIKAEVDISAVAETGFVLGVARSFLKDKLQFGIDSRYIYRGSLDKVYDLTTLSDDGIEEDDFNRGQLMMLDAGFIYNISNRGINPRFGMAVNNITALNADGVNATPYTVTASAGISPAYGIFSSDIIIDYVDITNHYEEDSDLVKRINMGMELRLYQRIALRAGLHQGYTSYGIGLDFTVFRLDYAYYVEEIGASAGDIKDKRQALELIIGF